MLNLPEGKTGQLYLADVLEQLETEVTNKKHITNQPAKVEDAVAEIDRDVSKEMVLIVLISEKLQCRISV